MPPSLGRKRPSKQQPVKPPRCCDAQTRLGRAFVQGLKWPFAYVVVCAVHHTSREGPRARARVRIAPFPLPRTGQSSRRRVSPACKTNGPPRGPRNGKRRNGMAGSGIGRRAALRSGAGVLAAGAAALGGAHGPRAGHGRAARPAASGTTGCRRATTPCAPSSRTGRSSNRVEVQLDFITSVGNKNLLTIAAEAQARQGHDVLAFPTWMRPRPAAAAGAGGRRDGPADPEATARSTPASEYLGKVGRQVAGRAGRPRAASTRARRPAST